MFTMSEKLRQQISKNYNEYSLSYNRSYHMADAIRLLDYPAISAFLYKAEQDDLEDAKRGYTDLTPELIDKYYRRLNSLVEKDRQQLNEYLNLPKGAEIDEAVVDFVKKHYRYDRTVKKAVEDGDLQFFQDLAFNERRDASVNACRSKTEQEDIDKAFNEYSTFIGLVMANAENAWTKAGNPRNK